MPPTDLEIYTLEGSIGDFFKSHPSITREKCDELAASLAGNPVLPVPIQGSCSYTVTAGSNETIVQFRASSSPMDMDVMRSARAIYKSVVASCTDHGKIGPLPVYIMEKFAGATWIEAHQWPEPGKPLSPGQESRVTNTVIDFARFFASSWSNPQAMDQAASKALLSEYQQRTDFLVKNLPSRFTNKLNEIGPEVSSLFSPQYPLVLSHGDLTGTNILIDKDTGHLTGITDWSDARVVPFGIDLWGLENVLGKMDSKGWHYYENRDVLVSLFWKTFEEEIGSVPDRHAIEVARTAGIFLHYGFAYSQDSWKVVDESKSSLVYLDALFNTSL